MFEKILIANRGEIALRIVRACKEMGVYSVVAYSTADEKTLAVQLADDAVCIGPPTAAKSYLRTDRLLAAAEICDVDALHPGYGFLAENADFAKQCEDHNIKFIGPSAKAINNMGDKAMARKTMTVAGVPITPGSKDTVETEEELLKLAEKFGYPVIIKASAGGGGKGMRVAHNSASLIQGFHSAKMEAEKAFSNSDVYLEKYLENPRHIEVQIIADDYGNVIHLGERDCSLQRRHQKLIEEAPSPALNKSLRKQMGEVAVNAAKTAKYSGAGTIEFLLDKNKNFYFMEMNTRVQVEHPVSECVTGVDIIKEQISVAMGNKLSIKQKDIKITGHAIECRINAEDPENNFTPSPGKITLYHQPGGPGVRIDSHAYEGYIIPPYYDSMVGKLICHGKDREEAITRSIRALNEYVIEGIKTTIPFELRVLHNNDFVKGTYDTSFLGKFIEEKPSV
ncbi:MAG: acetyl-CoA carboxylase biotin carboxylase subunit [Verrucomicrobiota bacterium]|nr:acetyl-CoA carboxylase biotin carboxylase subunit [Verrucomicrobiota bacterium]